MNLSTLYVWRTIDGYFKVINPAFTKLLGYSERELLENTFMDYMHPDDLEATYDQLYNLFHLVKTPSILKTGFSL